MPAQPLWLERLPKILAHVQEPGAPSWWDRPAIETLFGLRRRQAIALLNELDAPLIGTGLAIERTALLRFLENPRRRDSYREEQARSARVATSLGQARRDLNGRRISLPRAFNPDRIDLAGLPPGIQLQHRQLTLSFETPTELLEKLLVLSQALVNDYDSFEAVLAQSAGAAATP